MPGAIETIIGTYMKSRKDKQETFLQAYRRLGKAPFREALYGPEKSKRGVDAETEASNV